MRPAAALAWCLVLLPVPEGVAQIKILSPLALKEAFSSTHGIVYGSTATFGAPYYGERVLGRLAYGRSDRHRHCTEEDYDLDGQSGTDVGGAAKPAKTLAEAEVGAQGMAKVVLVRRGGCTFVTKVRVAAAKGAQAVVIVDRESSKATAEDVQKVILADDGTGYDIRIPSVLVSRFEGERLIEAAERGEVLVELAWDIPRGAVVTIDLWMSAGSEESLSFLEHLKDDAEALRYHVQFVPHYHVFDLPASDPDLCAEGSHHCAKDPDGSGPLRGVDVVEEVVRQLCLWNLTAASAPEAPHGVTYSKVYWEYVAALRNTCRLKHATSEKHRLGEVCSYRLMQKLGVPEDGIRACVRQRGSHYLDEEVRNTAWSPQALRINGWRYSGPMDRETVLQAICAGFVEQPAACRKLLGGLRSAGGRHSWIRGVSMNSFMWLLCAWALSLAGLLFVCRRQALAAARRSVREEVALEVHAQMEDYAPLQEQRAPARTLRF